MARSGGDAGRTAAHILDVAERLVAVRGFNAVSYADVAQEVGIRSASIHHHFPAKADLGRDLVRRYRERFAERLARIDGEGSPADRRLGAYLEVLRDAVEDGERLCLCTILAADYLTLPEGMRAEVTGFARLNEEWLAGVLAEGRADGTLPGVADPRAEARSLYAQAQGAQLVARALGDRSGFGQIMAGTLDRLAAPQP